ncbi:MAG TPA: ferritin [Tenuifilaceae bacterium]|nr:ferritin [Tenuifilaceae bacterium]HPE17132.1 ferritin [Tenuifilaceae bacterium]HPJ45860.1 ferritin [Tenuifilaceae bacterium]HPQ34110.1 ferritin [Tenuifilaceae bacterium]
MLNPKVYNAINEQINAEIWSAYMYLSMSAYFAGEGLNGFANWMRVQWQEELSHAMKFFDYIVERGEKPVLKKIDDVPEKWNSPLHAMEETLKHEQHVTALINNIMDVAIEEKDHATKSMLHWFIDEQVEEEANAGELVDSLKLIGDKGHGIYMLDKELKTRTFVDETAAQE